MEYTVYCGWTYLTLIYIQSSMKKVQIKRFKVSEKKQILFLFFVNILIIHIMYYIFYHLLYHYYIMYLFHNYYYKYI